MSKRIQLRRGTATENNNFTGAVGEVTVDTTNKTLSVHDGSTAGGTRLATLTGGLVPVAQLPEATTSTKGIVQLATTAIAQAGVNDTDFITAKKLRDALNATGAAPVYACRAWVNFNGAQLTGTYSQSGTLVIVTMTAHGMSVGQNVNLTFTSGTTVSGSFTVTSIASVDVFTLAASTSLTTSGNVTRNLYIRASGNVSSITDLGAGTYKMNFTTPMPDRNYCAVGSSCRASSASSGFDESFQPYLYETTDLSFYLADDTAGLVDGLNINVAIFR